jgi:hypothetical protein
MNFLLLFPWPSFSLPVFSMNITFGYIQSMLILKWPLMVLMNVHFLKTYTDSQRLNPKKKWCIMEPYAGVDYSLTLCPLQSRLKHIYHGRTYARVDLNPMPGSTLSPAIRVFLWIWPLIFRAALWGWRYIRVQEMSAFWPG